MTASAQQTTSFSEASNRSLREYDEGTRRIREVASGTTSIAEVNGSVLIDRYLPSAELYYRYRDTLATLATARRFDIPVLEVLSSSPAGCRDFYIPSALLRLAVEPQTDIHKLSHQFSALLEVSSCWSRQLDFLRHVLYSLRNGNSIHPMSAVTLLDKHREHLTENFPELYYAISKHLLNLGHPRFSSGNRN